jgi:hypothetical protein
LLIHVKNAIIYEVMTEIKTVPLLQAHNEGDVFKLAKATYRNEIPGFQDTRMGYLPLAMRMGHLLGVMDEIEDASLAVTGNRVPFTYAPGVNGTNSGKYAPHVDGGFRGLAIHENRGDGGGDVLLAHPLVNPHQGRREAAYIPNGEEFAHGKYEGLGMAGLLDVIKDARVHKGKLTQSGLTIFSEGNLDVVRADGTEYSLDPAIHEFRRDEPGPWSRVASQLKDAELAPRDLARKARHMRGHISRLDLEKVKNEKWSQVFQDPASEEIKVEDILAHPGMYRKPSKEDNPRMGLRDRRFVRRQLLTSIEDAKEKGEKHRRNLS